MPDRPVRVMVRDYDGTVREGWNVTSLIHPEQRAKLNEACTRVFGMSPPVELVRLDDLDALDVD